MATHQPGHAPWPTGQVDFHDLVYERLKKTPWFMTSLIVHLLALVLLGQMTFADITPDAKPSVRAQLDSAAPEELVDEPEEEIKPLPPPEDPLECPPVEKVETADDVNAEEADSEEVAVAANPYEGPQSGVAIGLGGGGGGPWGGRQGGGGRLLQRYRETGTVASVNRALDWLSRHQDGDGSWDADDFQAHCESNLCDGKGLPLHDPGVTGLALLAFLGAGHTHQSGRYRAVVQRGIVYVKRIQDPEGCFGTQTGNFMYSHAICTLAMAEAYGMTRSVLLRHAVEKGLDFIYRAENPNPSGTGKLAWRYTVQPGDNDASVTGWVVMALKSAAAAGLPVSEAAKQGARVFFDQMTDPATGRCGYVQPGVSPARQPGRGARWPAAKSEAITAAAMLARVFLGEDPGRSLPIQRGTKLLLERLPAWHEADGSIDQYYWYYGTLAMFQVGGGPWKKWNRAMKRAIIAHQRQDGCERGSWDPLGPWGADGGRVYSTALMTLCLEVYYRYPRVFGTR